MPEPQPPSISLCAQIACILDVVSYKPGNVNLFYVVARSRWNWSLLHIGTLTVAFLFVDLSLLGANAVKFEHGGWAGECALTCVKVNLESLKDDPRGPELLNRLAPYEGRLRLD